MMIDEIRRVAKISQMKKDNCSVSNKMDDNSESRPGRALSVRHMTCC
jgi:hypothetical protein